MNTSTRIASGSTIPGKTNWQPYDPVNPLNIPGRGVYVDIDTSQAGFTKTPNYVISLCGHTNHWEVCGSSAIYDPTPTGFRVNLRYSWNAPTHEAPPLMPDEANKFGWYVTWIGVEA